MMTPTEYYFWLFTLFFLSVLLIAGITIFVDKKILKR